MATIYKPRLSVPAFVSPESTGSRTFAVVIDGATSTSGWSVSVTSDLGASWACTVSGATTASNQVTLTCLIPTNTPPELLDISVTHSSVGTLTAVRCVAVKTTLSPTSMLVIWRTDNHGRYDDVQPDTTEEPDRSEGWWRRWALIARCNSPLNILNPYAILNPGDISFKLNTAGNFVMGTDEFAEWAKNTAGLDVPELVVPGNHDIHQDDDVGLTASWYAALGPTYGTTEIANGFRVVSHDYTSAASKTAAQNALNTSYSGTTVVIEHFDQEWYALDNATWKDKFDWKLVGHLHNSNIRPNSDGKALMLIAAQKYGRYWPIMWTRSSGKYVTSSFASWSSSKYKAMTGDFGAEKLTAEYSSSNNGTVTNQNVTIKNTLGTASDDGRIRLLMKRGVYTVSGASASILAQYDYGTNGTCVLVKVPIPASGNVSFTASASSVTPDPTPDPGATKTIAGSMFYGLAAKDASGATLTAKDHINTGLFIIRSRSAYNQWTELKAAGYKGRGLLYVLGLEFLVNPGDVLWGNQYNDGSSALKPYVDAVRGDANAYLYADSGYTNKLRSIDSDDDGNDDGYYFDPANAAVRELARQAVLKILKDYPDCDGVFFDNVSMYQNAARYNGSVYSKQLGTQYTRAAQDAQEQAFYQSINTYVNGNLGRSWISAGNLLSEAQTASWMAWPLDGLMIEAIVGYTNNSQYDSASRMTSKIQNARAFLNSRTSRFLMLVNQISSAASNTAHTYAMGVVEAILAEGVTPTNIPRVTYRATRADKYGEVWPKSTDYTALGSPTGEPTFSGNVVTRTYTSGSVATDLAARTVTTTSADSIALANGPARARGTGAPALTVSTGGLSPAMAMGSAVRGRGTGAPALVTNGPWLVQDGLNGVQPGTATVTTLAVSLSAAAKQGNLLVAYVFGDKTLGTFAVPSGWTQITTYVTNYLSIQVLVKVAVGGETSIGFSWSTATRYVGGWISEWAGVGDITARMFAEANSGAAAKANTQSTGTVTTTQAGFALAFVATDSQGAANGVATWDNSFVQLRGNSDLTAMSNNAAPLFSIARKALPTTGAATATATLGSGYYDYLWAGILHFPQRVAVTVDVASATRARGVGVATLAPQGVSTLAIASAVRARGVGAPDLNGEALPLQQILVPRLDRERAFYPAIIAPSGATVVVVPTHTRARTFYPATVNRYKIIQVARHDHEHTFYAAAVVPERRIIVARHDRARVFYPANLKPSQRVRVSLAVRGRTFYGATLKPAQRVFLPIVSRARTFFAGTVLPPKRTVTTGAPTARQRTFYPAKLYPRKVVVTPARYDRARVFYPVSVQPGVVTVRPGVVTRKRVFRPGVVTRGQVAVAVTRHDRARTFYATTVTTSRVVMRPARTTRARTFYGATVTQRTLNGSIRPALTTRARTFYGATVTTGRATISATRHDRVRIFRPALVYRRIVPVVPPTPAAQTITAALTTRARTFYAAAVMPKRVRIRVSLHVRARTFYAAQVFPGNVLVGVPAPVERQRTVFPVRVAQRTFFGNSVRARTFYPVAVVQRPQGGIVARARTFYGATVTTGRATISATRHDRARTFYAASLRERRQAVRPGVVTRARTFYPATMTNGAGLVEGTIGSVTNLQPALVTTASQPGQRVTWRDQGGVADLSGATITGQILDGEKVLRAITGTLTVRSGGRFDWSYSATDVASKGTYFVRFVATWPNATTKTTPRAVWRVI